MGNYVTTHNIYGKTIQSHEPVSETRLVTRPVNERIFKPRMRLVSRPYYNSFTRQTEYRMCTEMQYDYDNETQFKTQLEHYYQPGYVEIKVDTDQGGMILYTTDEELSRKIRIGQQITEMRRYWIHRRIPQWDYSGFILPDHIAIPIIASTISVTIFGIGVAIMYWMKN